MTTADWQNIANGLNLLVSGSRVGKHAVKNARAKQASLVPDKVQVEVVDNQGKSKLLVLDGDNAKAVRESDHSVESINKIVQNMEGMQNYQVTPKSSVFDFSIRMPGRKVKNDNTGGESRVWNPIEAKQQKASVSEVYDVNKYRQAYNSGKLSNWAAGRMLDSKNKVDASGVQNLDQFKVKQQGRVDSYINSLREQAAKYEAKTKKHKEHLQSTNTRISDTETAINTNTTKVTDLETTKNNQNQLADNIESQRAGTGRRDAIIAIRNARKRIATLESEKASITGKGKKRKIEAKQNEIDQQNKIIEKNSQYLNDNSRGSLNRARQAAQDADSQISNLTTETAKLQQLLSRLNSHKANLETRVNTHSRAFERLTKFKPITRSFNEKDYTFGKSMTEQELLDAGLFKQGGSINRNKINKFLNYAKG